MVANSKGVQRYTEVGEVFAPLLSNEMVVLQLSENDSYSFNETFRAIFHQAHPGCAFAWMTIQDWRRASDAVKEFTDKELDRIGLDSSYEPPLGYYLFRRFTLLGFHPGQIDWERDKVFAGGGALLGGLAGWFAGSAKLWLDVTLVGMEAGPASRLRIFFEGCLEFGENQDQAWRERRHVQEEVVELSRCAAAGSKARRRRVAIR